MVLGDDFSDEGVKKFDQKKAEIMEIFDTALPYFQKAESQDPNEMSVLIALTEIYAQKNDLEKSKIFKDRLDNVRNGGKNASSYFSN